MMIHSKMMNIFIWDNKSMIQNLMVVTMEMAIMMMMMMTTYMPLPSHQPNILLRFQNELAKIINTSIFGMP